MKKIISLSILTAMLSMNMSALAATAPSLDFLNVSIYDSQYSSVISENNVSFKLNEQFGMIGQLQELTQQFNTFVDFNTLFETLFDSSVYIKSKQITDSENESIKLEVMSKYSTPLKLNKNFEVDVNQNYGIWSEFSLSEENPVFNFIYETPFDNRYIVIDSDELYEVVPDETEEPDIAGEEDINQLLKNILAPENIDEINKRVIESIYSNAQVTGSNDNISIVFSDIGLKKYIADIFAIILDFYDEAMKAEIEEIFEDAQIENIMKNVRLFDDKALVMEYTLDESGRIKTQDIELNVKVDFYDLMRAIDENVADEEMKDNSLLSFSVYVDSEYSYEDVQIEFPELTEENSMSFKDMMPQYSDTADYESYEYIPSYYNICIDGGIIRNEEDKIVIPLRNILEEYNYIVTYDNGVISAVTDYKYAPAKKVEFKVGSENVILNDNYTITLSCPVHIINDTSYIRAEDIADVLDSSFNSYTYYIYENYTSYDFWYNAHISDFESVNS